MEGSDNVLLGSYNIGSGDGNIIAGNSNCLEGNLNTCIGNENYLCGDENSLTGNSNECIGDLNQISGDGNFVSGNNNVVLSLSEASGFGCWMICFNITLPIICSTMLYYLLITLEFIFFFVMGKLLLACLTFCLVATVASQPNIFEG